MADPSPESERLFGDLLVEQGLAKPEHVRECLALREELLARDFSPVPNLGILLRQKGYLTVEAYQQTVSIRTGGENVQAGPAEEMSHPPEVMEALAKEENRFGKYVRVFPLGAGGMGEVWKAWDTGLGRWVALKFLKSAQPEDLLRFRREAQTAGQVDHPHIAAIYEVGEKSGTPYIAMQYVEGQTLSTVPRNNIRETVRLLRDTALAVHAAHEKGIIHRDLKPSNIMVAQKETAHVYVMDFGLAKEMSVDTSISQSGLVLGTPAFMSPEQAQGKFAELDARSDIYSLGATLYELLTGRPPFQGNDVLDMLRKVVVQDPVPVQKRNPGVDRDLETIVMKCLRKEPEKRYPTAAALAEDLGNYLEGESISARPMDQAEKISRWAKRNRALSGALAALLLVVVAGGAYQLLEPGWKKAQAMAEVNGVLDRIRSGDLLADSKEKEKARKNLLKHRNAATVEILARELDALTEILGKTKDLDPGQTEYLKFLCETLGLLGIQEGAVEALGRYLEAERKRVQERAIPTGEALCFLGGHEADRLLLKAKERFGADGIFWRYVKRIFSRTGVEPKLEAETPNGYTMRGILRGEKGDLDGAIEDYTRALELDPKFAKALYKRGIARRKKGDLDGSLMDFNRAIKFDPKMPGHWTSRGLTLNKMGDLDGAIADHTRAIELNPERMAAWLNRGGARKENGDLVGAIFDFTRALELDPKMVIAWNNRGDARRKMRDLDGAIEDYNQALDLDPMFVLIWLNRGMARKLKGDLDGAISDYTRALEIDPKLIRALNQRGMVRRVRGDLEGAIADYTRAMECDPKYVDSWFNRGHALKWNGNLAGALADWKQGLKLAPNHRKARGIRAEIVRTRAQLEKQEEK